MKTRMPSHHCLATGLVCLFLVGLAVIHAENILPEAQRTNGAETLHALVSIQSKATANSVRIGKDKDSTALCGTLVSSDGYLLTKASDASQIQPLRIFLSDGSQAGAREVKRDEKRDLVLLKIERTGLSSVIWSETKTLRPAQWLCAVTNGGKEMRLGVVGATHRAIPNSGAVMGIRMMQDRSESEGVMIERITEGSPAEKAGLQTRDIVVALNGKPMERMEDVRNALSKKQPGDVLKLRYKRAGKEFECEVSLASRNKVELARDDFANHGTSTRTDNFPEVIQHDMPLSPADMGGAVYDLQGRAVGLNIARVDRVTNFALPAEVFQKDVERWIAEDRKQH